MSTTNLINIKKDLKSNYTVGFISRLVNEEFIENILRFNTTDEFEVFEKENSEISSNIISELLKILNITIETVSNDTQQNIIDIINIMEVNSEILTEKELLSIPKIKEFQNAYPNIFEFHCMNMCIENTEK